MVGENLDFLNIVESLYKIAGAVQQFVDIAHARDEYVADPDGLADFVQVTEHVENVLVVVAGEFLVLGGVDVLDVDEKQVGALHESIELAKVGLVTYKVYA